MAKTKHATRSLSERLWESLDPDTKVDLAGLRRWMLSGQKSDQYVRNTLFYVAKFRAWLDPRQLSEATTNDIQDWLIEIGPQYAVPSLVAHRSGLHSYYSHLSTVLRLRPDNPVVGVPSPAIPESEKDVVNLKTLATVLEELDRQKAYAKAVAISLLADTGMRAGELCAVRFRGGKNDVLINTDEMTIAIPGDEAKSKKARLVGYNEPTALRIDRWQAKRPDRDSEWLLTGQADRAVRHPYTVSGLRQMVQDTFAKLAPDAGKITPHDLRHTWATHTLDHPDARESATMAQAGWNSVRMLRNYTRRTEQKRAVTQNRVTSPLMQMR